MTVRWGMLSTAGIGQVVAEAIRGSDEAEFVAVAGRGGDRVRMGRPAFARIRRRVPARGAVSAQPRVRNGDLAIGADQFQLVAAREIQRHVELSERVAGQRERRSETQIAAVGTLGCVNDLSGADAQRLPAEQPDRADAVTAQVQYRTAAQPSGAPNVARRDIHTERSTDVAELPDRALRYQLLSQQLCRIAGRRGLRLGMMPPHEAFDAKPVGNLRRVEACCGVRGGDRERLLTQHVLASLQGRDRPFGMQRDGQRNIDHRI
jgi:hypothetical protein